MSITISAEERDALYEEIYVGLTGLDGVWVAASAEDFEGAAELARAYSDSLRLILDDLGWGEGSGESLELTTPPDVLRRILTRLHQAGEARRAMEEQERTELRTHEEETRRLLATCERLLAAVS